MRFHNDDIALSYSFYDVITLNETNKTVLDRMKKLRERCIEPGIYYKHFLNWLKHFTPKQFFLIDGDKLRYNPFDTLTK